MRIVTFVTFVTVFIAPWAFVAGVCTYGLAVDFWLDVRSNNESQAVHNRK
jgi:hypothetical protein